MKKLILTIIVCTLLITMPIKALAINKIEIMEQIKLIIEQIISLQKQLLIILLEEQEISNTGELPIIPEVDFRTLGRGNYLEPTQQPVVSVAPVPEEPAVIEPIPEPVVPDNLSIKRTELCYAGFDCYDFTLEDETFTIKKMSIYSGGESQIILGHWYNVLGYTVQFQDCYSTDRCVPMGLKITKNLVIDDEHTHIYFPAMTYINYMHIVGNTSGDVYECEGSCLELIKL